jgi:hypothetical protein
MIDRSDLDAWADAYIQAAQSPEKIDVDHPLWWAIEKFFDIEADQPEIVWAAILSIIDKTSNDRVIGNLAAGPLEELIGNHGPAWIDRIENEARRNPKFRHLLGGVWQSSTPEIWARVEKARVKAW